MQELLAKLKGRVNSGELYRVNYKSTPVDYEMGQLKSVNAEEMEGWALRVIHDGKIGFSSSTSESQFEAMAEKAIEVAQFGQTALFDFPAKIKTPRGKKIKLYDSAVAKKSIAEMVEIGNNIVAKVNSLDSGLRCDAGIAKFEGKVQYENSYGATFSYQKTSFANSIMIQDTQENDMMMLMESQEWGEADFSWESLWSKIEKKLEWGKKIVEIENGYQPVIFTPKALLVLMLPLIAGLNGRMVNKKISPLQEKKGELLFNPMLSIYSDGTIDYAEGSALYDDEGIAMGRLPLIVDGVLQNYYYDLQNAAEAGVKPTGNGLRNSFHTSPSPGISNLIIPAGTLSFEEMVKDIKSGIIVDQVLGLGQGNILSGAFSNNVQLGYRIDKGKIVGRIKNVMIAGNALEVLKDIVAIGKEAEWVSGRYHFPPVYLKAISVSTKD
ncbi:MAG TPA: TldD/PmbA family protein [Atribacterota bacterium]|nr:TldD/PmbA family protein [Atribacterota bacterium]